MLVPSNIILLKYFHVFMSHIQYSKFWKCVPYLVFWNYLVFSMQVSQSAARSVTYCQRPLDISSLVLDWCCLSCFSKNVGKLIFCYSNHHFDNSVLARAGIEKHASQTCFIISNSIEIKGNCLPELCLLAKYYADQAITMELNLSWTERYTSH